jgi:hypothetical protein
MNKVSSTSLQTSYVTANIQKFLTHKFLCVATSLEFLRLSTADSNTLSLSRCPWWNDCSVASVFADEAKTMRRKRDWMWGKAEVYSVKKVSLHPSWSYFPLNQVSPPKKGLIFQSVIFSNVFFMISDGRSFYYSQNIQKRVLALERQGELASRSNGIGDFWGFSTCGEKGNGVYIWWCITLR